MVEFYILTFPRFPLQKKEHKSYFGKNQSHDFRTSRCAGYLLDHSGEYTDETAGTLMNESNHNESMEYGVSIINGPVGRHTKSNHRAIILYKVICK